MQFLPVGSTDARLIQLTVHADERGAFARTWCADMFSKAAIDFVPVQGNSSYTRQRGSVRGMHFQASPRPDAKIVRCSRGRIHDIIVDLRADSPNRGLAFAHELSDDGGQMLYVPPGFAHGFQTLIDDVIVEYLMGEAYVAELYDGFRPDDPVLALAWPEPVTTMSRSDRNWPDLAARLSWIVEVRA